MALFDHRAGNRVCRGIAAVLVAVFIAGCSDVIKDTPLLTGNTFDRYNDLAIPFPDSENVNISYEYGHVGTVEIAVPGEFTGEAWLFSENSAALPERFVTLHLVEPEPGGFVEVGRELSVGKGVFTVKDYCVSLSADDTPQIVVPYVSAVLEKDFALSESVFVRRFVSKKTGLDGKRLDVAFVEDIVRKGYDCSMLDNFESSDEGIQDFIEELRGHGDRSFEVVG